MRFYLTSLITIVAIISAVMAIPNLEGLTIDILKQGSGSRKTKRGDTINVHYTGTLAKDGSKFDSSLDRGDPLSFTVGQGQVIKGWDEGLLDMAVGEKRKLTIAPALGYGNRAMGPIPAGSTLSQCWHVHLTAPHTDSTIVFETELMDIKGGRDL